MSLFKSKPKMVETAVTQMKRDAQENPRPNNPKIPNYYWSNSTTTTAQKHAPYLRPLPAQNPVSENVVAPDIDGLIAEIASLKDKVTALTERLEFLEDDVHGFN